MKYRVKIEVETVNQSPDRYQSYSPIYEQTIEDMDVLAVIKAVNGLSVYGQEKKMPEEERPKQVIFRESERKHSS